MNSFFLRSSLLLALLLVAPFSVKGAPVAAEGFRDNLRGARYGEIVLVKTGFFTLTGKVYNTLGLNDCPEKEWKALSPTSIKLSHHAVAVLLNGPRCFLMDQASILKPGRVQNFGSLQARHLANVKITPAILLKGKAKPYTENPVARTSVFRYMKGRNVYELVSPQGTVYVMQSFSMQVDPKQTISTLPKLGSRLHLPQGWKFRVVKPDSDLTLEAKGKAIVLQDELENSYQRIN
jgi:haloalkane dehalogenase